MSLVKFNNSIIPSVFDHFFDSPWSYAPVYQEGKAKSVPATNIKEDETCYSIELAVPGLNKEDIKINLDNDRLTISAEQEEKNETNAEGYTRKEFSYSSFSRTFTLPENSIENDNVSAEYKNGILFVTLPKREELKPKPAREINIA